MMLPLPMVASSRHYNNNVRRGTTREYSTMKKHYHRRLRQKTYSRLRVERQLVEKKGDEDVEEQEQEQEQEQEDVDSAAPSPNPTSHSNTASSPTEPNIFVISDQGEDEDDDELDLIPFVLHIQGTNILDTTNEIVFRWHLQDYFVKFFHRPTLETSTILESILLDRPWVTTSTTYGERRQLQETSTQVNSTMSSGLVLRYKGHAILKDSAAYFNTQPTLDLIQEVQIIALEDTVALQEYFVQLLFGKEKDYEDNRTAAEGLIDDDGQQPVIFVEVQVDGRALLQLDPAVTWDRIHALDETRSSGDQEQLQSQHVGCCSEVSLAAQKGSPNRGSLSTLAKIIIIFCTLVVCAILGTNLYMRRAKRKTQLLQKLPGAPDVHALEIVSEVDSEEHMDDIIYDKSLLRQDKSASPTMTRTSSWCEDDDERNNSGVIKSFIPRVTSFFRKSMSSSISNEQDVPVSDTSLSHTVATETDGIKPYNKPTSDFEMEQNTNIIPHRNDTARPSADRCVIALTASLRNSSSVEVFEQNAPLAAPRSILSNPLGQKVTQEEHDELDSVVANVKLHSMASDDDESMMGYSLASNVDSVGEGGTTEKRQYNQCTIAPETQVSILNNDGHVRSFIHASFGPPDLTRQECGGEDGDSSIGSDRCSRNSMFPGVQNLLNITPQPSKPKTGQNWLRTARKKRQQGCFSSDSESVCTLQDVLEEVSDKSDCSGSVFIEDDAESVEIVNVPQYSILQNLPVGADDHTATSFTKESEISRKGDCSVHSEMDHVLEINGLDGFSALGYYNHYQGDDTGTLPQLTPVPSEEMDDMVLKTPVIANSSLRLISNDVIRDDVSDAPSDEQSTNVAPMETHRSLMGTMDPIETVPSLDRGDPAVAEFLMRERRQRIHRARIARKPR
jgi:hypothetical protein